MKNLIITNGKTVITVSAVHNVTVTESNIIIDLERSTRTYNKAKSTTVTKITSKLSKTRKTVGRPRKTTV